jgi:uncharacterized protein YbjT (DUF2867 family)
MKRILIVGATGRVGRLVVSQLPAADAQIRAVVRNPQTSRLPEHVEVFQGDLTLPETLDACLEGVDAVFLVWVAPPATTAAVMERIARHARRIVFLSAPLKTNHPFLQQSNAIANTARQVERDIENSGMEWTFLRPGMFASNAVWWWAAQIRAGDTVRWPYISTPTAPIDERDIAAIGVRALCEDGHAGVEYVLTGPESLTFKEQILTIGDVLGRSLRVEELSREEARVELEKHAPPLIVNMLLNAFAAGAGHPTFMTSTFQELTGRPPRTFRQWAEDHIAAFRL